MRQLSYEKLFLLALKHPERTSPSLPYCLNKTNNVSVGIPLQHTIDPGYINFSTFSIAIYPMVTSHSDETRFLHNIKIGQRSIPAGIQNAVSIAIEKNHLNVAITSHIAVRMQFGQLKKPFQCGRFVAD